MSILPRVLLFGLGLLAATPALAQATACRVPSSLPDYRVETPPGPPRPGAVAGYLLALSWSPEYCRKRQAEPRDRMQCSGAHGRFGFILHGLWPESAGRRAPPAWCGAPSKVPPAVVARHLCVTPSAQLIQHEWQKHGTCGWSGPARYLRAGTALFGALRFPDMNALSRAEPTAGDVRRAFAAINPGLPTSAIRIKANRRQWLREVEICLNQDFRPHACTGGVGARDPVPLLIWRGG
jgi:ribonuclease T2